jgi:hypothetical protein
MKAKWGDSQTKFINRVVKAHDHELYAERGSDGTIRVLRKGKRFVKFFQDDSNTYYTVMDSPQFVCALTHNWLSNGIPRDWGSEVLIKRLKYHDVWNNEDLFAKLDRDSDKRAESKKRDWLNNAESWLSDQYSHIKKSWSDINTANMDKTERRRRRFEANREFKNK